MSGGGIGHWFAAHWKGVGSVLVIAIGFAFRVHGNEEKIEALQKSDAAQNAQLQAQSDDIGKMKRNQGDIFRLLKHVVDTQEAERKGEEPPSRPMLELEQ